MSMLSTYFTQFNVIELIAIRVFYGDCFMASFTNSSAMVIYSIIVIWFLWGGHRGLIPYR